MDRMERLSELATVSAKAPGFWPNKYDVVVFLIVFAAFVAAAVGAHEMRGPLNPPHATISLDPANLPHYALLTTLRMFAAILVSLVFAFVTATTAAKSRRAEMVIIPALDILQSVPVLGFLAFTVVFFLDLFPGSQIGAECAAIFAIFTSQAWNMAFSFYQSLRTVPRDLDEAVRHFRLSGWQRFWRFEAPYATPGLVWNTMMSMSGGWFFVVASEAIVVGDTEIALPGVGSYLALAIESRDISAVVYAVVAMAVVILIYDQLVFRPIVAWSDKFRMEQTAAQARPESWLFDALRRTRAMRIATKPFDRLSDFISRLSVRLRREDLSSVGRPRARGFGDYVWIGGVAMAVGWAGRTIILYAGQSLDLSDVAEAVSDGFLTLLRVVVLIVIASVVWVPVGVWIGLRPAVAERIQPLAQFLAAFPANVLFPIFVVLIARNGLDANVWLSPLMILGAQWYILFNVIAGAAAFPNDLREVAAMSRVRGWQWWRSVILPGVFPYYVTGALTASGGAWNASIVAEVANWGTTRLEATGLGAYIAIATEAGDHHRVVLGVAVMSVFVILLNRVVWRPLYVFAERRLRLA